MPLQKRKIFQAMTKKGTKIHQAIIQNYGNLVIAPIHFELFTTLR